MKKKIVLVTLSLLMAMSAFTGCGKSDAEKAKDEIMSHMSDDEKANIAADQKEIENWEKEQQEKQEALEAELAALPEYSEDILKEIDIDWITPLKVIFIDEQYCEVTANEPKTYVVYESDISGLELTYGTADSNEGQMSYVESVANSGAEDAFFEKIGDYTIGGYDKGANIHAICINTEGGYIAFEFYTSDDEVRKDIYNRNVESLKSQLQ